MKKESVLIGEQVMSYIHVGFINRNAFRVIFRTEKRVKMPTGISGRVTF